MLSDVNYFEKVYREYHSQLFRYAKKFVYDNTIAEEIVQELFLYLWEHSSTVMISTSIKSYLYMSVRNRCINELKKKFLTESKDVEGFESLALTVNTTEDNIEAEELHNIITEAIAQLPEKCRVVFQLSREVGFTYQEISKELNISVKTVEAQMGTALKRLRKHVDLNWCSILLILLQSPNYFSNFFHFL